MLHWERGAVPYGDTTINVYRWYSLNYCQMQIDRHLARKRQIASIEALDLIADVSAFRP
jgi:hypothetical protein